MAGWEARTLPLCYAVPPSGINLLEVELADLPVSFCLDLFALVLSSPAQKLVPAGHDPVQRPEVVARARRQHRHGRAVAGLKQKQLKLEGSWFESFSNISWYKREEELPFESLIVIFVPSILCVIWAGTIWALPERIVWRFRHKRHVSAQITLAVEFMIVV